MHSARTETESLDWSRTLDRTVNSAHPADTTYGQTQAEWADTSIERRLEIIKAARHRMASMTAEFAAAISPRLSRNSADTLVAELLPLLAAAKFLEQRAPNILQAKRLGRRGLPFWLAGVDSEIHRVPIGKILIIAPSNYPLLLPGVQALQALTAGNAVVWKPGQGGSRPAHLFAEAMYAAGLPRQLLRITDESVEAVDQEITTGVDKVFLTGSAHTGRALLTKLAATLTPCVLELSGCDALIVLPSADLTSVAKALAFGMRLNGSATCMAPRRVLLVDANPPRQQLFATALQNAFREIPTATIPHNTLQELNSLLSQAQRAGATVIGDQPVIEMKPLILLNVTPTMEIAQADIFAPIVMLINVAGEQGTLSAQEACPYALTASIFGDEHEARKLARKLTVGTVLINDVIVPTADPRIPFAGRRNSGFGATRGAEGLFEMTAVKTIAVRKGSSTRHFDATTNEHESLFNGVIQSTHASGLKTRLRGLHQMITSAIHLGKK
jgi:acyl-CoA reductase-like NAD-dependent aldehyde dehydrogenase